MAPHEQLLFVCYLAIARSRSPGLSYVPCISIRDIESCYRVYELEDLIDPRDFTELMFSLDSVTQERYKQKHPTK